MTRIATAAFDLAGLLAASARVLEALPWPAFVKDPQGVYLWANKAWPTLMALEPERIAGSSDADLFPPDFGLVHSEPDRRALAIGEKVEKLIFVEIAGRPKRRVELSIAPIAGPDGRTAGLLGVARDVTAMSDGDFPKDAKARRKEALSLCTRSLLMSRASDEAIAGFLRHLGEITGVDCANVFENFTTPEGELWIRRRYAWAQARCQCNSQTPEAMPYGPWLIRWHLLLSSGLPVQGTIKTLPPEESALLADEGVQSVLVLPLEVNGRFWGFVRLNDCRLRPPWEDAEVHMLSVAAESLSAFLMRTQSEGALRRKIEEQEALWNGTPDLLYIKDTDSVYQAANPAFAALAGMPAAHIAGKTDFDFFPTKLASKFREEDRRVIEAGEILKDIEDTLKSASECIVQIITTKVPLRGPGGVVVGIIGISRDITERVELERQVRTAQKMESVGTLAAGIAHDFNNLLTAILGFSHLALPKLDEGGDLHHYLGRIAGAGTRAKDLIRQLLTFSRQAESEKHPIELTPVLKETVKFLQSTLPTSIEIVSAYPETLPCIEADPTQVHQVLMNLCVNASHAMPEGGTLTIRLDEIRAALEPAAGDDAPRRWIQLTVQDTGCGMDEATKARIFEPFFTTKEPGKGTGLGLSTVYGIVKDCGGTIEVDTAPGKGTTFRLRFPATDAAAREEQEDTSVLSIGGGGETVLFVDDEPALRELGQATLGEAGYTVFTAADGAEALSLYEQRRSEIALVITDTTMPRMTGLQFARHVLALDPAARIVLCSGNAVPEAERQLVEAAHGAVLMKPYIPANILTTVRRVLDA